MTVLAHSLSFHDGDLIIAAFIESLDVDSRHRAALPKFSCETPLIESENRGAHSFQRILVIADDLKRAGLAGTLFLVIGNRILLTLPMNALPANDCRVEAGEFLDLIAINVIARHPGNERMIPTFLHVFLSPNRCCTQ